MNMIDFPIERINKFFSTHIFEVNIQPTHDNDHVISTNVKVKLTGVKEYISIGEKKPFVEYTITILPTNETSDKWSKVWASIYGEIVDINTSSREYSNLIFKVNDKLNNFLKYFGVEKNVICTKVINNLGDNQLKESLIIESKADVITREIVKDIIDLFKFQRNGEFELPVDVKSDNDITYSYSNLPEFNVEVNIKESDDIESFDVESSYYFDDDIIEINIVSNPKVKFTVLYDLIGELNDQVRHELEHMIQYHGGYKLPKKEPKKPYKYYTQPHEIGAQVAGIKRKSKLTKSDFEKNVRNWFKVNKFKHNLPEKQVEKVILKILKKHNEIR